MLAFLQTNAATIVISAALIALVAAVVAKMLSDRRKGATSYAGGCANCPNASTCHNRASAPGGKDKK